MTKDVLLGPSLATALNPLTNFSCFAIALHHVIIIIIIKAVRHLPEQNILLLMAHPVCWRSALFMYNEFKTKGQTVQVLALLKWSTRLLLSPT